MKSRTISKILLCTLPVSFIQHGYSSSNEKQIGKNIISGGSDNILLMQGESQIKQQENLRNMYAQQLIAYTLYGQFAKEKDLQLNYNDKKTSHLMGLCNRLSEALLQTGKFDPNRLEKNGLVSIFALEQNEKGEASLIKKNISLEQNEKGKASLIKKDISELDRFGEQVIFNGLLDNILNMIFSEKITLKKAAEEVSTRFLGEFLRAKNLGNDTKLTGAEAEGLKKLKEEIIKQRGIVVQLLSGLKIQSINVDRMKNLKDLIQFNNSDDGDMTATLKLKDREFCFSCNKPESADDQQDQGQEKPVDSQQGQEPNQDDIEIWEVIKTGRITQERINVKTDEVTREYLQEEGPIDFFTSKLFVGDSSNKLKTKEAKIKQTILSYLELMYSVPELRKLIDEAATKYEGLQSNNVSDDCYTLWEICDLYSTYDTPFRADSAFKTKLAELVDRLYKLLQKSTKDFQDINFDESGYNYSWLWFALRDKLISQTLGELGVDYNSEMGYDGQGNVIPTFCINENNDIGSLEEILTANEDSLGSALIIGGIDKVVDVGDEKKHEYLKVSGTTFPSQLLAGGSVYCLTGISEIDGNHLIFYSLSLDNVLSDISNDYRQEHKGVMAVYRRSDSLGLRWNLSETQIDDFLKDLPQKKENDEAEAEGEGEEGGYTGNEEEQYSNQEEQYANEEGQNMNEDYDVQG